MVPKKRGRPKKVVVDEPKSEINKRVESESIPRIETEDPPKRRVRKAKSIEESVFQIP